uniref:Uncharacterized protein n=1 Tax=Lepeophtheirus salmonis TaxID=72036 RepID=A0A0K2V841_LEPSM
MLVNIVSSNKVKLVDAIHNVIAYLKVRKTIKWDQKR